MFRSKAKSATGLHFGDDVLHIVTLSDTGGDIAVDQLASVELPSELTDMAPADPQAPELMAGLLNKTRADLDLPFGNTYCALHRHSFLLKQRQLAPGGAGHSHDQLQWEAMQFLNGSADDFAVDYLLTRKAGFVVIARKVAISWMRTLCGAADIDNPAFDVAPFALYNALEANGISQLPDRQLLIDVDRLEAKLVLVDAFGTLAGVETCRWDCSDPLPDAKTGAVAADVTIDSSAQVELLLEAIECLDDAGSPASGINRIWVSGDDAAMWCELIAQRASVATKPLDPFAAIDDGRTGHADTAALATAAGLAFRGLSEI